MRHFPGSIGPAPSPRGGDATVRNLQTAGSGWYAMDNKLYRSKVIQRAGSFAAANTVTGPEPLTMTLDLTLPTARIGVRVMTDANMATTNGD